MKRAVPITPRGLLAIAGNAMAIPALAVISIQLIIWCIPGCDPVPYSTTGCVVLGHDAGAALLLGVMGGIYVTLALALLVSAPLVIAAAILALRRRGSTGKVS